MKKVKIYTDGACFGNPGPGGWAVVINTEKGCMKYTGHEADTTNNRMELEAVIHCLKRILEYGKHDTQFYVYSDSAYVVNSINNNWIKCWKKNGWKTKRGEPVKNKDLWEQAAICLESVNDACIEVKMIKIKGHSGNTFNEMCDRMAKEAASSVKLGKGARYEQNNVFKTDMQKHFLR